MGSEVNGKNHEDCGKANSSKVRVLAFLYCFPFTEMFILLKKLFLLIQVFKYSV